MRNYSRQNGIRHRENFKHENNLSVNFRIYGITCAKVSACHHRKYVCNMHVTCTRFRIGLCMWLLQKFILVTYLHNIIIKLFHSLSIATFQPMRKYAHGIGELYNHKNNARPSFLQQLFIKPKVYKARMLRSGMWGRT